MPIKVQWDADGPFAICDTAAEAVELMKQARNGTNPRHKSEAPSVAQTTDDKIGTILGGINDKARKLLKALVNYPEGIEGESFGKVCGTIPAGFGGVLGGISKEAKKVRLTVDDLVKSESRWDGERRYRWLAPTKLLMEHKNRIN